MLRKRVLRAIIQHHGDSIELPLGETIVGRDISCQLRLNDGGVSRRHARFVLGDLSLTVEDLGSRNGTTVNGRAIRGTHLLQDHDEVTVGDRTLQIRIVPLEGYTDHAEPTGNVARDSIKPEIEQSEWNRGADPVPLELLPARVIKHSCPQCRARVPIALDRCSACGYAWPRGRPLAVTLSPSASDGRAPSVNDESERAETIRLDRRKDRRRSVELAVIYTSPTLTFDAVAHDLSRHGMFVRTELLEPVGTQCKVIVLPDVSPAVSFGAVVSRVVQQPSQHESFAGLGLMFSSMEPEAQHWLDKILTRLDASAVDRVFESVQRERGPKR